VLRHQLAEQTIEDRVGFVVTNYKTYEDLEGNICALRQAVPSGSIVVADSAADESAGRSIIDRSGGATYIPFKDNVGFARCVNIGIDSLQPTVDYILVLNADVEIGRAAVESLLAVMDRQPELGVLAPVLRYPDGRRQVNSFRFYTLLTVLARRTPIGRTSIGKATLARFELGLDELSESQVSYTPVDWVLGAAMMVRRSAVRTVGTMDDRYFLYFEDVDWCKRMWNGRYCVGVTGSAQAVHKHGGASRSTSTLRSLFNPYTWIHVRSAIRYFWKHSRRMASRA